MDALIALYPVFLFFVACVIVGKAAEARGRNAALWFFVALLITPVLAFAAVLTVPKSEGRTNLLAGRPFR